MKNNILITITTQLIIPICVLFAFYIQIHGEISPGGGFQTGAVLATGYVLYYLTVDDKDNFILFKISVLKKLALIGFLIYALTGVISFFDDQNYLNYYALGKINGQMLGISLIELGVCITVSSVLTMIFLILIRYE